MDTVKVTAQTPLVSSTAFDTIQYFVLLDRLSYWNGMSCTVLTWIRSLLTNKLPLFCNVPQVSVLGQLMFILYTTPLTSLIHSDKLDYNLYADDTQVYISLSTADTNISLKQLGDCLSDSSGWMTNNKLRFNANKKDFIIIGTSRKRSKFTLFFPWGPSLITPSDTVRNHGQNHCYSLHY